MSAILWFVTILLLLAVILFTPLNSIILRYLYKNERITPTSSTAQNNVRIHDHITNKEYVPMSVEPIGDDINEFDVRVESKEAPYRESTLRIRPEQLKCDTIEVIKSGFVNLRMIPLSLLELNDNPEYTPSESLEILASQEKEINLLKGEVISLKANEKEHIDDAVQKAIDIATAKYSGVPK